MEPAQFSFHDRSGCITGEPKAVSGFGRNDAWAGGTCGEQPGGHGDATSTEDQSELVGGAGPDSGCAAGAGDCRRRALCGELGDSIGEDAAYGGARSRSKGYADGGSGLDALFRHAVAAGGMEDARRARCSAGGLFGMRRAVHSAQRTVDSERKGRLVEGRGFPPFPQEKAERMGHGQLFGIQGTRNGKLTAKNRW